MNKILYPNYWDETEYYIVNKDKLTEAKDLSSFDACKVYNFANKTSSNLNELVKEACDDLEEEYYDCVYKYDGDDIIAKINEKFNMKIELEICDDWEIFEEGDIIWDKENKEFCNPDDFETNLVNFVWDDNFRNMTTEVIGEFIEITDDINFVCLDEQEFNRTNFYTGGYGCHVYVAYMSKNQYIIEHNSEFSNVRDVASIVTKDELIEYLESVDRDVNHYLKKIHN